jgi:hypothetical protein
VPVLESDDERAIPSAALEQQQRGTEDLVADRVTVERLYPSRERLWQRNGEKRAYIGQEFVGLLGKQRPHAGVDLVPPCALLIALVDEETTADYLTERPVAQGAPERQAVALQPSQATIEGQPPSLLQQPGLSEPSVPDKADHATLTLHPQAFERCINDGDFSLAAKKRLPVLAERIGPLRTLHRVGCQQLVDRDRLRLAFQQPQAKSAEVRVRLGGSPHRISNQDFARARPSLDPRSDVGRVADGGVVHAKVLADAPHDNGAAVQPHADTQASIARGEAVGVERFSYG